jgi:hypothetical protein
MRALGRLALRDDILSQAMGMGQMFNTRQPRTKDAAIGDNATDRNAAKIRPMIAALTPDQARAAMIANGREYIFDQWWVATFPGLAIGLVALGFNLLGDGLRDVLDAR